jgi:thiamine-monophosphate kinase
VLTGGDDYELLFTVPPADAEQLEADVRPLCPLSRIGAIESGDGVRCLRDGVETVMRGEGYDHFA